MLEGARDESQPTSLNHAPRETDGFPSCASPQGDRDCQHILPWTLRKLSAHLENLKKSFRNPTYQLRSSCSQPAILVLTSSSLSNDLHLLHHPLPYHPSGLVFNAKTSINIVPRLCKILLRPIQHRVGVTDHESLHINPARTGAHDVPVRFLMTKYSVKYCIFGPL